VPYIPHHLLSFRGSLGPAATPQETWSFGLRYGLPGVANPTVPAMTQAIVDAAAVAGASFAANSTAHFQSDTRWLQVKGYEIGADGRITAEPFLGNMGSVAGVIGTPVPWQCSAAVTLFTGGLGKGRFGRVYMPPQRYIAADDGMMQAADATAHLAAFISFLNAIKANAYGGGTVMKLIVASQVGLLGSNRAVTQVRWGRVVDTQRRRRRSLKESYALSAYTP
jgi:hypothetical protein